MQNGKRRLVSLQTGDEQEALKRAAQIAVQALEAIVTTVKADTLEDQINAYR